MKKVCALFMRAFVFISFTSSVYAQASVSMQQFNTITTETEVNSSRSGFDVLVIRDMLPWGWDATVPVLNSIGATVSTATSATYPSIDFSQFDKIVVESIQPDNFYLVFQTNLSKFETYVNNGGVLQINTCTYNTSFNLPGGASSLSGFSFNGIHASIGHPILSGVPDPFFGFYASHNYISNLPSGAEVITLSSPQNLPTTVIYPLGNGIVIATGLTMEIAYSWEANGQGYFNFGLAMYPNMLGYILPSPPSSVPLSNWAIFIGLALIGTFISVRYRYPV